MICSAPVLRATRALVLVVLTAGLVFGAPTAAGAHSLESSTISLRVDDDSAAATISLALETLDEALGTDLATEAVSGELDPALTTEVIAYLDEHLTVRGADGAVWVESYAEPTLESVEGITSFSVVVDFETGGAATADLTITYDAIIEAVGSHEAVVVLTNAEGDVATAGILDASKSTLDIGEGAGSVAAADMVGYGFHHVLEGADHLLFLAMLLLSAPLVAIAGRWHRREGARPAFRRVVHVVTAFTIGHSLTLVATATGWISLPSRPVEVLIAASVGVSAIHAIRPLAERGEVAIAAGFGLVHGMAFAGILRSLGLEGTTSLSALFAFNIGVELAQLTAIALVFPSLYLISRTTAYPAVRVSSASIALAAAAGWLFDRLGLLTNPLAAIADAAIGYPWWIVGGLAALALGATAALGRDHAS